MNFYNAFFLEKEKLPLIYRELSPNEYIIYSELLPHSLSQCPDCYDRDTGKFSFEFAKSIVESDGFVSYHPIEKSKLAERVHMTTKTVRKALEGLEACGIINNGLLLCSPLFLKNGYIQLEKADKLKGLQLILYNYIKNRQSYFGGSISTWEYKIANACHTTTNTIKNAIHELKDKHYIERLSNGKLRVL